MVVFGGEDSGWQLGHEGGALMNEISAFLRRDQRSSLIFPLCEDSMRSEQSVPRRGPSPEPDHDLWLPASTTVREEGC